MDGRFLAFAVVMAVLIATPGPDMAMTTRNALRGGRRAAFHTAFGVTTGSAIWALAAAFGIAGLLAASAAAFTVLKVAGAAYLVGLGLVMLVRSRHAPAEAPAGGGSPFIQGLLNNLLNPKAAAIFVTLFPQFVEPGDPWPRLLAMVATYEVLVTVWLCMYGVAVVSARRRLGDRVQRLFDRITGVVLVGLGVRLAFERR